MVVVGGGEVEEEEVCVCGEGVYSMRLNSQRWLCACVCCRCLLAEKQNATETLASIILLLSNHRLPGRKEK